MKLMAMAFSTLTMGWTLVAAAVAPASTNLALGKPYTMSMAPSYEFTADAADATQLTDGVYTKGMFWTQKTTVGWNLEGVTAVTVDLGKTEPISGFSWNCAAGNGVLWPAFVNVYTSDDRQRWKLVGDLLGRSFARTGPPAEDAYSVYRAEAHDMPAVGRYVMFLTYAAGLRCVDEIEIYRGPDALLANPPSGIVMSDPAAKFGYLRMLLAILNDTRELSSSARRVMSAADYAAFEKDLQQRRDAIAADTEREWERVRTVVPFSPAHADLLALNARTLQAAGYDRPVAWINNRWENLSPLAIPARSAVAEAQLTVEMMRGETRAATINVLNPSDRPIAGRVSVEGLPPTVPVDCREVLYTLTPSGATVGGALAPGDGSSVSFEIPAGCSKQVWIALKKPQGAAGVFHGKVWITAGQEQLEVPLRLKLHDVDFPVRPRLHVAGWDYVDAYPNQRKASMAQMREFYRDLPIGTLNIRPQGAKFGPDGALLNEKELDFSNWDAWMALHPDARLYGCVMCNDGGRTFMGEKVGTPRFHRMLSDFCAAWSRRLEERLVPASKVVLQLVDEPWKDEHDARQIAWYRAVKAGAPGFTVFSNPNRIRPEEAQPELFEACDILCPQLIYMKRYHSTEYYTNTIARLKKGTWFYSCSGPSRTLDPCFYFRAQCWSAFQFGAEASCYWAFGYPGGYDSWHVWEKPKQHRYREYTPYFVSPDGMMPAKQSEGIREGVQDHELFSLLADAAASEEAAGRDASAMRKILSEELVAAFGPRWNIQWNPGRDHEAMDAVRIRALRAYADWKAAKRPLTVKIPHTDADATPVFQRAVTKVRAAGGGIIEFEKGTYTFGTASAAGYPFVVSNHNQVHLNRTVLPLVGLTNVTVKCNGSLFLVDGEAVGFLTLDSENIRIENVAVDWTRPFITEAKIEGFENGKTRISIDPVKFPHVYSNGCVFAQGKDWTLQLRYLSVVRQDTHALVEGTTDFLWAGAPMEKVGDHAYLMNLDFSKQGAGARVGDIIACRSPLRTRPGSIVNRSKNVVYEDVAIHSCWGMGLICQFTENFTWRGTGKPEDRKCGVFSRPGTGKVFAANADASHFSNCRGTILEENCLFEGMMDDAINVHATSVRVTEIVPPNLVRCRFAHGEAYNFALFRPGEHLRLIKGQTLENGPALKVKSFKLDTPWKMTVELAESVPAGYGPDDAVENADLMPEVIFRNNVVARNRARGALFATTGRVVVENNLFDRVAGSAILFPGDAQGWFESGAIRRAVVRGNTFRNCNTSYYQFCDGIISFYPMIKNLSAQTQYYHRGAVITNNVFETFRTPLVYARSTEEVTIAGNTVRHNDDFQWMKPCLAEVVLERCRNIRTDPQLTRKELDAAR